MNKYGAENPMPGTSRFRGGLPKKTVDVNAVRISIRQAQGLGVSAQADGTIGRACRNVRKKAPLVPLASQSF